MSKCPRNLRSSGLVPPHITLPARRRRKRTKQHPVSSIAGPPAVVGNMASASDAMDAAVAAANRIDAVELQLTGIAQQLQLLLAGGSGAGGAGGGGGGAGGGGAGGGGASLRRRIDTSCLEKLHGDASLAQLRSWRNRWNDFCHLSQLNAYPANEQMAAFRMALDPAMQQVVEVALGILPTSPLSPSDVIDRITDHVRSKRNNALDRVA